MVTITAAAWSRIRFCNFVGRPVCVRTKIYTNGNSWWSVYVFFKQGRRYLIRSFGQLKRKTARQEEENVQVEEEEERKGAKGQGKKGATKW